MNLVQPLGGSPNRFITEVELTFDGGKPVRVALGPTSRTAAGQTITFPTRTFAHVLGQDRQTNDHRPNLFGQEDAVGFAEIRLRDVHATHDVRVDEVVQMPSDLLGALGASSSTHPLVLVMNRDAIRPVPPRTQPELALSRSFDLPAARTFSLTGNATVSPDAPNAAIERALRPGAADAGLTLSASGFLPGCLACRADAALDGTPDTAWQTPFDDAESQWVQAVSPTPITLDHLDLSVIADGRHSVPTAVRVTVDGSVREVTLPVIADQPARERDDHGARRVPAHARAHGPGDVQRRPHRADAALRHRSHSGRAGRDRRARHPRAHGAAAGRGPVDSGCRSDLVTIDGQRVPVRVTGPASAAGTTAGLTVAPCGTAAHLVGQGFARARDRGREGRPGSRSTGSCSRRGRAATAVSVASGRVRRWPIPRPLPAPGRR